MSQINIENFSDSPNLEEGQISSTTRTKSTEKAAKRQARIMVQAPTAAAVSNVDSTSLIQSSAEMAAPRIKRKQAPIEAAPAQVTQAPIVAAPSGAITTPSGTTVAINSHPKLLKLNPSFDLTHNSIELWGESIREFANQQILVNHLQYISGEARCAIDARMRPRFSNGAEWRNWPFEKLYANLLVCWPQPHIHDGQSLEVTFRSLTFKVNIHTIYRDVTRLVTQINLYYGKEIVKSPGLDTDAERQKTLVRILMDKLKPDAETLSYLNTSVSDGGLPTSVDEFTIKLMQMATRAQDALYLIESAGLAVVSKKRSADSNQQPDSSGKRQNRTKQPTPPSEAETSNEHTPAAPRGAPATVCKGCGWTHSGDCLMRTHPDFNSSNQPWHASPSGQRYFTEKGLTKLPWDGPFLDPTTVWLQKPPRPTKAGKPSTEGSVRKGHHGHRGRGRGNSRGTSSSLAAPIVSARNSVLACTCTLLTTTSHCRKIIALVDSGSPDNYASASLAEWAREHGGLIQPVSEACVCSALSHSSCSCSKEKLFACILCPFNDNNQTVFKQFSFTALIIPIIAYDVILGWPAIQQHQLFNVVPDPVPTSPIQTSALEHVLFGAVLRDAQSLDSSVEHISQYFEGSLVEEGDDLTDRFSSEAPWETNLKLPELSSDTLIDMLDIKGNHEFRTKIRAVCRKYQHCFSLTVQPNPADVIPLTLDVDHSLWEVPRNAGPPRPQSDAKREEIKLQIDKMLKLGVIQPSQAPYYSHPHLIKKPDGSWRFCIDYRQLNNASRSLGWPIPNIELLLRRVGKHSPTYFGKFDLTSGYHQTALAESTRAFTAFLTDFGLFEWLRCPFGLKGAPSYFQRAMHTEVLTGLIYNICEIYIDDILFWGSSEEDYLTNLETILARLSVKGITLNPKKCKLGLEEVEYTGHVLDKIGLSFSSQKKEQIINFTIPTTQKELRSFLGLANYFRDHIRNHSLIVHPLHDMVRNYAPKKKLIWDDATLNAFSTIKDAINACPKLHYLDDISPVYLQTDASDYGVGAYLFQVVDGIEHPIIFLSKTFKSEQKRWSAADKECYAIVWAFKELEHLLRDRYFILRTDHKNLTYLNLENSGKIRRWKLLVQEYNCGIEHIRGADNFVADDFSRLIPHIREDEGDEVLSPWDVSSTADVGPSHPMMADPVDEVTDDAFASSTLPSPTTLIAASLVEEPVPRDKYKLISNVHNSFVGHMGVDKTYARLLAQGHKWTNMRSHISTFIRKHCACCQKMAVNKILATSDPYTLGSYDIMQKVAIDATGHLPKDANGNSYLVSIIDHFSRFIELYPVPDLSAREFAKCLLAWIGRYGAPTQLLSDKGTQFCNSVISELCRMVGSEQIFTMTASKQENGIVERSIKEIRRHLRNIVFTSNLMDNWSTYLPLIQRIMNADVKEALGVSPAQLLFGNAIQLDRGIFLPNNPNSSDTISDWMQKMLAAQSQLIHLARMTQERRDDQHMSTPPESPTSFPINSYVLVTYTTQPPTTLHAPNEGPLRVVSSVTHGKIMLQNLVTGHTDEYHVSRLRPFYYDDEDVPRQTANRDSQQWDVDHIVDHSGDKSSRKTLKFRVRWAGFDASFDTWQPYADLRHNTKLHEYLRIHKMKSLIPLTDK